MPGVVGLLVRRLSFQRVRALGWQPERVDAGMMAFDVGAEALGQHVGLVAQGSIVDGGLASFR